eukprot:3934573-Rhodomonas_salina.2
METKQPTPVSPLKFFPQCPWGIYKRRTTDVQRETMASVVVWARATHCSAHTAQGMHQANHQQNVALQGRQGPASCATLGKTCCPVQTTGGCNFCKTSALLGSNGPRRLGASRFCSANSLALPHKKQVVPSHSLVVGDKRDDAVYKSCKEFFTDDEMDLVQKKTVHVVCKSPSGFAYGVAEVEAQGLLHVPFFQHLIQFHLGNPDSDSDTILTEINVHEVIVDYVHLLTPKQLGVVVTTFCEILATPFVLPVHDLVDIACNKDGRCGEYVHAQWHVLSALGVLANYLQFDTMEEICKLLSLYVQTIHPTNQDIFFKEFIVRATLGDCQGVKGLLEGVFVSTGYMPVGDLAEYPIGTFMRGTEIRVKDFEIASLTTARECMQRLTNGINLSGIFENSGVEWDGVYRRVVAAGGSVCRAITEGRLGNRLKASGYGDSDLDLFLVGAQFTADQRNVAVSRLAAERAIHDNIGPRASGLASGLEGNVPEQVKLTRVQLITTTYSDVTHLLMSFDIDCCCVAYESGNFWTIPRGKRAHESMMNIVSPYHPCAETAKRLLKYSLRGFGVLDPMHVFLPKGGRKTVRGALKCAAAQESRNRVEPMYSTTQDAVGLFTHVTSVWQAGYMNDVSADERVNWFLSEVEQNKRQEAVQKFSKKKRRVMNTFDSITYEGIMGKTLASLTGICEKMEKTALHHDITGECIYVARTTAPTSACCVNVNKMTDSVRGRRERFATKRADAS